MAKEEYSSNSKFTAGAFKNYLAIWVVGVVSSVTLGIATPWILCWYMRFIASHTEINGKKVVFEGTGGSLFGNYIKWLLLSVVTAGIYWLVAGQVKLAKWLASNTHLEGCYDKNAESKSDFTGKWYQMWGVSWLVGLLCSVTLGIGFAWAACYLVRWYASHVVIDGHEMEFDGRGGQLVGKCILWSILTVITCGIYSFWLTVKVMKWLISHIHLAHPEELANNETPVETVTTTTTETVKTSVNSDGSTTTTTTTTTTAPVQQKNTLAIVALILAFFIPPAAIICGAIGLKKAKELNGDGKGLALAGLILGILFTVGYVLFGIIEVIVIFVMTGAGEAIFGGMGALLTLLALAL